MAHDTKDTKNGFKPVDPKVTFPELEENILKYWQENKIFEKSIESRPEDKTWTFLDGPPFVTGMPHYGSLLSSLPKDLYPRFKTMQGYRVRRVWGWDGHGLPIENKVENELNIERKRDIEEKIGVKKFIEKCFEYVSTVSGEWEWYVDRIGRWTDFKNAYRTWDTKYMESVMWVFKQMYEKDHIYKGLRVSLFCPHCSTPISNFEVAMDADNYKTITEPANTYKYQLKDEPGTYLLAWSTTPWNKIVTPALAVNPDLEYVKVQQGDEKYILAKDTLKMLTEDTPYKIIETFKGKDLEGLIFVPHYDFYPIEEGKKAFLVVADDFVTADEGTGIVTLAAYGEEDMEVMKRENIQIVRHVDDEGHLTKDVPNWGGMYYMKVNKLVNEDLEARGLMYREDPHTHSVAHCWRCGTRLFYNPQNAWYVNIQDLKDRLLEQNERANWYPDHFKHGRFAKSVESAPDWCISRSRYWGSPVPVWELEHEDGEVERFVPGSIQELEEASGAKISDLHKPEIDEVTVPSKKDPTKVLRRVPEVLDSWIEAGSAAFAERHYPFTSSQPLENFFPPDFIGEYTGQIRAWFYVLHVIAVALEPRADGQNYLARNVLVEGVIKGTDGRKMSKNFGNYPDPKEMISKYGGDALRMYLLGSPVMNGEDIRISEEEYRQQVRGTMLILWNVYNFFVTYAGIDNWTPDKNVGSENIIDAWIHSRLESTTQEVTDALEKYDSPRAINSLKKFIDELSTWYIRRSRGRVGQSATEEEDKNAFYTTTHQVLLKLAQLLAPITPFLAEEMYTNLTSEEEESVHLTAWPDVNDENVDLDLEKQMEEVRKIVEIGHAARKKANIPVKTPLQAAIILKRGTPDITQNDQLNKLVKDELNILNLLVNEDALEGFKKKVEFVDEKNHLQVILILDSSPELEKMGKARELIRMIQQERKKLGTLLDEKVAVTLPEWPEEYEEEIRTKVLAQSLEKGDFQVSRI